MTATPPIASRLACTFRFRHPNRGERETCGLPVLVERPGHEPLCPWHDAEARPEGFNVKEELQKQLRCSNHWLEGAKLAMEDLRGLSGIEAQLPSADLEGARLDGAVLHKAILDDASLISTEMSGAKLSYASFVGTRMDRAQLSSADLTCCNLAGARLHGTTLDRAFLYGIKLSTETIFLGVVWGIAGELLNQHLDRAASVFRTLHRHFRSLANHGEADAFYFWEMTALHLRAVNGEFVPDGKWLRSICGWIRGIRNPRMFLRWVGWTPHRWVWGYGVRPSWTLYWMLFVVLFFGLVFFPCVGIQEGEVVTHDPLSGIALSVVTFATLGYGNRTPFGTIGELFGGLEAILGALLMSAFIVALATRYVHAN